MKLKKGVAEYLYKTPTQSIRIVAENADEAYDKLKVMKKHFILDDKGYIYVQTNDAPYSKV